MPFTPDEYLSPSSNDHWLIEAKEKWKLDRSTGGGDHNIAFRFHRLAESNPDHALTLIAALAEEAKTEEDKTDVSETLEWLLRYHGETYWEVLNEMCKKKNSIREIMSYVWGAGLPRDLKRKVEMWR